MKQIYFLIFLLIHGQISFAQLNRCEQNNNQDWWDVQHYELNIDFNIQDTLIKGFVIIEAKITDKSRDTLQIDLHPNFRISAVQDTKSSTYLSLDYIRRGDRILILNNHKLNTSNKRMRIKIAYEGKIPLAVNPPWSGGLTVANHNGRPFWGISCQMDGVSIFFPCKDILSDEPDEGVILKYTVPYGIQAEGNGKLLKLLSITDHSTQYIYEVKNPINTYNITFYLGDFEQVWQSMKTQYGVLDYRFAYLKQHKAKATKLFQQIPAMINAIEYWCGPYPFYDDGFKLVESPYLGMEHQSAIAYGNQYLPGYLGKDRSGTGVGLLFDFILVHESAHEWFGNSISTGKLCDMWIQEGFTTYLESLYLEQVFNIDSARLYRIGKMQLIKNENPVTSTCYKCKRGDGDEYDKAAAMIHNLRMILNNDVRFREMLHDMNTTFYHQIVDSEKMIALMQKYYDRDISKVFEQYLKESSLPKLDLIIQDNTIRYRWSTAVKGFDMPYFLLINLQPVWIYPTEAWQTYAFQKGDLIELSKEWLINL